MSVELVRKDMALKALLKRFPDVKVSQLVKALNEAEAEGELDEQIIYSRGYYSGKLAVTPWIPNTLRKPMNHQSVLATVMLSTLDVVVEAWRNSDGTWTCVGALNGTVNDEKVTAWMEKPVPYWRTEGGEGGQTD